MKPAVDIAHLSRYTGGDEALNAEVLQLFDTQISEMVGRLRAILDAQDAKSWKEVTHTLKGAARGIGAFGFADAAAAAGDQGDFTLQSESSLKKWVHAGTLLNSGTTAGRSDQAVVR